MSKEEKKKKLFLGFMNVESEKIENNKIEDDESNEARALTKKLI